VLKTKDHIIKYDRIKNLKYESTVSKDVMVIIVPTKMNMTGKIMEVTVEKDLKVDVIFLKKTALN
jgi:hypothetical protein